MSSDCHDNDPRFVEYYASESATAAAGARSAGIMRAVLRMRARFGDEINDLLVGDIGCNAGTQSRCWLGEGHRVRGIDISRELVMLARQRNADFGSKAEFDVGSATSLPWDSSQFDVCLLPELLDDWRSCLMESIRVLKPGGTLFVSTTNVLCPRQQEFTLPLYSWYPNWAKKICVRKALTDAPRLANFATYPAVHWFSPYSLKRFLSDHEVDGFDRFDVIDVSGRGAVARILLASIKTVSVLRFIGHVLTPATIVIGRKRSVA